MNKLKFPRLSRCLAAVVIIVAVLFAFQRGPQMFPQLGAFTCAGLTLFLLSQRAPNFRLGDYVNTVDPDLILARNLDIVLEGFAAALLPVKAFSMGVTNGMTLNQLGTKKVQVQYIPRAVAASKDFNAANGDCYEFGGSALEKREVLIDQRKYQAFSRTSEQAAEMPLILTTAPNQLRMLGYKLAQDVIANVLSIVDDTNFPNESAVGAASGFDTDKAFDVRQDANDFRIPKMGRSMILKDDYFTALLKDNKDADKYGNSLARWEAQLPKIAGFDVYETEEGLDAADDVDAGIVVYPSAILFAQAPIEPLASVRRQLDEFQIITHEESGLSLVYKRGADWKCDMEGEILECTFGKAVGEEDAIMRLVTN